MHDDDLPRMTLAEHLEELRTRVGRSALAVGAGTVAAFAFHGAIFDAAVTPYREAMEAAGVSSRLQAIDPLDGFVQPFKLAFLAALVATAPYVLWQMWGFVAAGLYPHEKRAVRLFFPLSVALFALGCLTAVLVVLPAGLRFLAAFADQHGMRSDWGVGAYLSLCLALFFGMGLAFQLPLVMLFLQAVGMVERATFRRGWRVAVLLAFVIAMVMTPDPTPMSQVLMAGPLLALYALGTWGGRFVGEARERLTPWKAWPVALAAAMFAALFVWRDALREAAGALGR